MGEVLNIGRISFTNMAPVFRMLESEVDTSAYNFVPGYPAELNRMLREGELDLSPSSSIEYLKDRRTYKFLEGHSIASTGPVESILLFSRMPLEALDSREIFITHQSETSPVLLDIILRKFYGLTFGLKTTSLPIDEAIEQHSAYLAIGDEALLTLARAREMKVRGAEMDYGLYTIYHQLFYIYDLGALWHRLTGLPFVYALWLYRRDRYEEKRESMEMFRRDLDLVRPLIRGRLREIAREEAGAHSLSEDRLISYWNHISYELDDEHLAGLELFGQYATELGYLLP